MAKSKKAEQIPITTPEEQPPVEQEQSRGRVLSLPSILKKPEPEPEPVIQGAEHKSRNDDTLVSLEEFNAVAEILHPGRTPEELDARTEVNSLQIIHFSRARVMAKRFGIKHLDLYVTSIERLSLSHKRKSRLEHVKSLSGLIEQNNQTQGLLQRLS